MPSTERKPWRSPGEVWRAYEAAHAGPHRPELRYLCDLCPDDVLPLEQNQAWIDGHYFRGHQACLDAHRQRSGGRDLI